MMNYRKYPVGAEIMLEGGVDFRVWAPACRRVEVILKYPRTLESGEHSQRFTLTAEDDGYFSSTILEAGEGTEYWYRLDGEKDYPDPASRFQPEGPSGPSEVINPDRFQWSDHTWKGTDIRRQVIYELHVGTFTQEGTWTSASEQLSELAALGVTTIEVLPVADFPGQFGWGYDGVNLFAPTRLYGRPEDFKAFVDRAHNVGLAVILDAVYNHLGPEHAYLKPFAPQYFSEKYKTEWGDAFNFDGVQSGPVREFFRSNAAYWIDEYHLDGLRLDATQSLFDASEPHILAEITQSLHEAARGRSIIVIGENEPQQVKLLLLRESGGYGLDALWNEDFHRSAMVALTGNRDAYYGDYLGTAQEFVSASKRGFLYQGQLSRHQQKRRGTNTRGISPEHFVFYLQNHDQVANSVRGLRVHNLTSPSLYRAMTALLLLGPATPMLFQGQEFAASSPFLYFSDHGSEVADSIGDGRADFLSQFPNIALDAVRSRLPNPGDRETFLHSKLDFSDRQENREVYLLHRDLLKLRREDPVIREQGGPGFDGAVLNESAFLLRFFGVQQNDRLLLFNFGKDLHFNPAPEPLLAPLEGKKWHLLWSSEELKYGGEGTPPVETEENWRIRGNAAMVFVPEDAG